MADLTPTNESITEVVPKTLGIYLLSAVSELKKYYDEFPSANRRLDMPSVSIIASGSPEFRARMNIVPQTAPVAPDPPTAEGEDQEKQDVNYVVGFYDTSIQLDIWAGTQEERDDMFDAVFNALNPNISPMGLVLTLGDYFGVLCDYLYVGHTFADSEERSQRDEWRATLTLLATCNAIRTRKEFVIEDTQTPDEIEEEGQIDETVVIE